MMPADPAVLDSAVVVSIAEATMELQRLRERYEADAEAVRAKRDAAIRQALDAGWTRRVLSEAATEETKARGGDPVGLSYYNIRRVDDR
jgi:uncharacterized Ntn-hydrolase superfamily protein